MIYDSDEEEKKGDEELITIVLPIVRGGRGGRVIGLFKNSLFEQGVAGLYSCYF